MKILHSKILINKSSIVYNFYNLKKATNQLKRSRISSISKNRSQFEKNCSEKWLSFSVNIFQYILELYYKYYVKTWEILDGRYRKGS